MNLFCNLPYQIYHMHFCIILLGSPGKVLVVGELQGWLLCEAARSFLHVLQSQHQLAPRQTLHWPRLGQSGRNTSVGNRFKKEKSYCAEKSGVGTWPLTVSRNYQRSCQYLGLKLALCFV